ncbi:daptide-type RiPP [Saccharothrix sp. NRRL B-16314]|nr:daptide-type RiPP [Saccharothrix sp. NRRL B-16314]
MSESNNVQAQTGTEPAELELQELESMEAPGWWTAGGVVVGISITVIAAT